MEVHVVLSCPKETVDELKINVRVNNATKVPCMSPGGELELC